MNPNIIIKEWLELLAKYQIGNVNILYTLSLAKQTDFTKSEGSRSIARLLLIYWIILSNDKDIATNLSNKDELINYVNQLAETNQEAYNIIYHGLEFNTIISNIDILMNQRIVDSNSILAQLPLLNANLESIYKAAQQITRKSNNIQEITLIINVLHGFRFDSLMDDFFGSLLQNTQYNKVLTFGTKNSILLYNMIGTNKSILAITHDTGRWRENYLLSKLYNLPMAKSELGNLLDKDIPDGLYDKIILSGNSTKKYPDYDIEYYKQVLPTEELEYYNHLEIIYTELSSFGFEREQVKSHIGASNIMFAHLLYALRKINSNHHGRVFMILKESDISYKDIMIWEKISEYIENIFYLENMADGNKVLFVLKSVAMTNSTVGYFRVNFKDKKDLILAALRTTDYHGITSKQELFTIAQFKDFYFKSNNRGYYRFYVLSRNQDENLLVSRYFNAKRFRTKVSSNNINYLTDNSSPTNYIFLTMASIGDDGINYSKVKYLDFDNFNIYHFEIKDELMVGDIIVNRHFKDNNFRCVIMTEDMFKHGNKVLRYIADENIIVLRLNPKHKDQFMVEYGLEVFYSCLKSKLIKNLDAFINEGSFKIDRTNIVQVGFNDLELYKLEEEHRQAIYLGYQNMYKAKKNYLAKRKNLDEIIERIKN